MAAKTLHDIARVGLNVLAFAIDSVTGLVTAQLGNVVTQKASSDESEWYYPPGIVSLPQQPDAGKAGAEVAVITRSDHDQIVGCRDARDAALVTAVGLDWGEMLVFSPKGGGYVVFRKDGSILVSSSDVKIGDANAVALAKASAISDLQSAINGWSPVSNDGGAALKLALADWIAASYATTKAKGT